MGGLCFLRAEGGLREMAGVLEAMGFPRDLCERAVSSGGGIEPALELLLQWQADGGAPPAAEDRGSSPSLSSPPRPSVSGAAVSSVTDAVGSPAGLDAVVPDAGIVEQNCRPNATECLEKVGLLLLWVKGILFFVSAVVGPILSFTCSV